MELITRIVNTLVNVHPWHSMVVHFPIGLTGGALLFLVLALWRRNEALEKAAFFNITLAAVSTVVAGIAGIRDNIVRFDGAAPNVNAKIFLAVTLLALTTVTAISRWRQQEILWKPSTMVLYASAFLGSFALTIVLGFLGGVIIYGF
jgi:uncharacterized membrane protein